MGGGSRSRIPNPWKCEHLEAPGFQAKVAFIFELLNHSIVEMLCPSGRPAVLVDDYYIESRPIAYINRLNNQYVAKQNK